MKAIISITIALAVLNSVVGFCQNNISAGLGWITVAIYATNSLIDELD